MSKIIEIKACSQCMHVAHTGAFTKGGPKPCCNHPKTVEDKGNNCFKRVIPYKNVYPEGLGVYHEPRAIPEWCPLDDLKL